MAAGGGWIFTPSFVMIGSAVGRHWTVKMNKRLNFLLQVGFVLTVLSPSFFAMTGTRPVAESKAAPLLQVQPEQAERRIDEPRDDLAAFLCGRPGPSEVLKPLRETESWKEFAAYMDKNWAELEKKRLRPLQAWAASELAEANSGTRVLFYPFGGPDLLTACLLFPAAETYVLVGLERVGNLPEFDPRDPGRAQAYLENVKPSLSDFFLKSYFITREMDKELRGDKVDGVLPIICLFLKKAGMSISEIKRVEFDEKGDLSEMPYERVANKRFTRPYGVRIAFIGSSFKGTKNVYYFSCDLSDERFAPGSRFYSYLERLGPMTTFVKSASYLLHFRDFLNIRKLIMDKSPYILQDDTGIPYRYFSRRNWDIQLFGRYSKPPEDFTGVEQADLKAAYSDRSRVRELPFHLGYHWGSNLDSVLLIKRKTAGPKAR